MIIERHKCSPELAKALDATRTKDSAGVSHYATLDLPDHELIVETKKQKVKQGDPYPVSVIVAVAMKLYGGERLPEMY